MFILIRNGKVSALLYSHQINMLYLYIDDFVDKVTQGVLFLRNNYINSDNPIHSTDVYVVLGKLLKNRIRWHWKEVIKLEQDT